MTCKDIEQDLALASANCLEASRLPQIREHCRHCPECAAQWQQIQRISSAHRDAATELEALPLHYRRSAARARQPVTCRSRLTLDSIWRWRLPVGALAVLAVFFVWRQPIRPSVAPRVRPEMTTTAPIRVDPTPNLAAYRNAIEKSGEASLDALLARDANHFLRGTAARDVRSLRGEVF